MAARKTPKNIPPPVDPNEDTVDGAGEEAVQPQPGKSRGLSTSTNEAGDVIGLGAPSAYVLQALSLRPEQRTSAQREAIKVRRRAEDITVKSGRRVEGGGITSQVIGEEMAPQFGRRDAATADAYYSGQEQTLAARGRTPDGRRMTDEEKAKATNPPPAAPASAAPAAPRGFAMRTMADGSVRTASGGTGLRSNIQNFGTQEEAMAFFRPPAPAAPAGTVSGQPVVAQQPAPAPQQASPTPAAPVGAAAQTPAAARTTSPTQQLATSIAKGPAPAAPTAPAAPSTTFSNGATLATPLPNGQGFDLTPGLEELRRRDSIGGLNARLPGPDLPQLATANRDFGVPKRKTGYQQQAEELNPMLALR